MGRIELYQFQGSHYNEKARWGLDWKRVAHERRSLLPGPHMLTMKRLTGRSETPALVDGDQVIAGSTAILEHLERRWPVPALFPEDPAERERALEIVRHWDEEVGPAVRLYKFFEVLDADYVVGTFGRNTSAPARALYRLAFPVIERLMKDRMAINAENAEISRKIALDAFDFVAREPGEAGYLVGSRFSVADLTCASLLMPYVSVSEWGGPEDASTPKSVRFDEQWVDHPGSEWVREMYRRHRRPAD